MKLKLNDREICGMRERGLGINEICAYKWLFNKRSIGRRIIVYYNQFREWMTRNSNKGRTISKRHASRVIHNLGERGFAEVKSLGGGAFEITLFSLDFVFGQKSLDETNLSSRSKLQTQDSARASPNNTSKASIMQQQLIEIKKLCAQAGIKYRLDKDWWEIASHGIEKIEETINLMKHRARSTTIHNPPGWLRKALRENYYLDYDPESTNEVKNLMETYEYCLEQFNKLGFFPHGDDIWVVEPSEKDVELTKKVSTAKLPKLSRALKSSELVRSIINDSSDR